MLPLTKKSKERTFAVILMTAHTRLRKQEMEGFSDDHYLYPIPPILKKKGNRHEAMKITLRKCDKAFS